MRCEYFTIILSYWKNHDFYNWLIFLFSVFNQSFWRSRRLLVTDFYSKFGSPSVVKIRNLIVFHLRVLLQTYYFPSCCSDSFDIDLDCRYQRIETSREIFGARRSIFYRKLFSRLLGQKLCLRRRREKDSGGILCAASIFAQFACLIFQCRSCHQKHRQSSSSASCNAVCQTWTHREPVRIPSAYLAVA